MKRALLDVVALVEGMVLQRAAAPALLLGAVDMDGSRNSRRSTS